MKSPRRVFVSLIVAALAIAGALVATPGADAADLFGVPVSPGSNVTQATAVPGIITLTDVQVSATANGTVDASATMYVGASPTPMAVSVAYKNAQNWTLTVARNSAGGAYQPAASTSLDINKVSGTITETNGALSYDLTLSGQVLGDGTFDMAVHADSSGLVASAVVSDLEIGGIVLESASIQISTVDSTADLQASMQTRGGNFDAELQVSGSPPPGAYSITLNVDGAELAGEGSQFHVDEFSFTYTFATSTNSCTDISVGFSGKATIGNDTYTLKNGTIAFCGETLETFIFAIEYEHYIPWQRKTVGVDLTIAWSGKRGVFTKPSGSTILYQRGFFGSVNIFQQRTFSKKYSGRTFNRSVKIGLAFGVAVYTPYSPFGSMPTTEAIGGGGYVDADRLSGAIGCVFQVAPGTDMNCGVHMRINPSWAGIYHYDWNDL